MPLPRVLVVGGGFAGVECLHRLEKALRPGEAELVLVSPDDYQLYLPLLPQVASGLLTPQSVAVSLRRRLRRSRYVPGIAVGVDPAQRRVSVLTAEGPQRDMRYDILLLAAGSTTRLLGIPGVSEYAHGMKTLAQAAYLRDHVIGQLDAAAIATDPEERAERLRFVVVGGGYAGTETAAALQLLTHAAVQRFPRLDPSQLSWHLVDIAPRLLPEIGEHLGDKAIHALRKRGIEISLETSVTRLTPRSVELTDGRTLPTRTLVWTAGVAASPLVKTVDTELIRGRLATTPQMDVLGAPGIFAVGDAAAVPDLARGEGAIAPPTAQHSQRQGKAVARNIVATLRGRPMKPYYHRDLGLVVDLGDNYAVSRPLGIELSGLPAQAVARGYHLFALPTLTARTRVAANWALNATTGDDFVCTGFQRGRPATLTNFEHTELYQGEKSVTA
ncbi:MULTISPECIES: NAD(P)/FAD-dependent oxidoreductase [unclassified Streptomyces]|uniref:NAD(P)/FAD-dependent oxidoreductase n=1 Tax=unclassified Streptomyces TaxID=2593676 RepID=UPI0028C3FD9B|nr:MULTISPECIES: NAD(P)/FAD-dependent oxidoreductase [unclassified Streptomyces]WNO76545.1 NAD(P)/FAD-dependent oxidoreductase [Streptomyces sp. AM8-1-1]